ncbi:MAG: sn-glycerol-3-phosphate ABC transporter permease UgpA [Magnetococcales bacterium]|nr:sn-glycerol-3-phosphate ABC transporter permease UgpA [Magnetococcales bacterium]
MAHASIFRNRWLPHVLILPQLVLTLAFFIWPAGQAFQQSLFVEDPFGLGAVFVGWDNFAILLEEESYLESVRVTLFFSVAVAVCSLGFGLLFAVFADRVLKGAAFYKTLIIWPYAVAPAVAGVLWLFLFNPTVGVVAHLLGEWGIEWNHTLNGNQALFLVVLAASWKQVSFNFLFFLAGLKAVPLSLVEAAAMDGAGPWRRFWTILFPLLSPVAFFLLVVNVVYAFFDTFGVIHQVTGGGPDGATNILVFKVFHDGFLGLDLGGSAAQSVVLMLIVTGLTIIQFRVIEHRVHY